MQRIYENIIHHHFDKNRQMIFMTGPRQVGKTSIARTLAQRSASSLYRTWDSIEDQARITQLSYAPVLEGLSLIAGTRPLLILEEMHRFKGWRPYLKGFYDSYEGQLNFLITNTFHQETCHGGGDSLIGRYFSYRIHPLTIGENPDRPHSMFQEPQVIAQKSLDHLLHFGGFPEPWSQGDDQFLRRWQLMRQQQLIYEDIRGSEGIANLRQLDLLANLLKQQVGELLSYTDLAKRVRVSVPTIQRWIRLLEQRYFCYTITPWHEGIPRALVKIPKMYLWDWSVLQPISPTERHRLHENFVASHLLKAVHYWTDLGFGDFSLHYICTKDKKKIDFVVVREGRPWMLVEVKASSLSFLSTTLQEYQEKLQCPYAFQIAFDIPFTDKPVQWLSWMIATNKETDKGAPATILPAGAFLSVLV